MDESKESCAASGSVFESQNHLKVFFLVFNTTHAIGLLGHCTT